MYAPAGVTQEEGHTGLLHLPSAVLAVISTARRIQPSFSLVNRQVELHFQQSRVWIKRVWLPRSAKQETCFLPSPSLRLKVWHCETDSTISSRVSLFIIHSQAVYGTFSRDSSRFLQQHPQILPTPIRSAPSLSGHTIGCRKRLLPRILRHRVSCPQGSSSKGYRLFRKADELILCVARLPRLFLYEGGVQSLMHNRLMGSRSGVSGGWGVLCLDCSRKTFVLNDCSLKKRNGTSTEIGANNLL